MFHKIKLPIILTFSLLLLFGIITSFKAKPAQAAAINLKVETGCFGGAGFVKFSWGASSTKVGDYYLDVRVPGGSWPSASSPGQNVDNLLTYTWGGLSGVAPIGGFTPGQAYEWRIWDGTTHTYGANFTAPATCGGGGGITLSATVSGNTVNFTLSPSDGSYVVIADRDCPDMPVPPTRDFDSGQLSPGTTTTQFTAKEDGNYCAKIVKALSGATLSSLINFTVGTGGKNWNDPGPPPPPFDIMDVFQPAKRFGSFGQLASDVLLILVSLAGGIALIFIMISGFKFVTSSGDEKKLASARATLTYAIIGIAVVILAFVIVQILQYFLQSSIPIT